MSARYLVGYVSQLENKPCYIGRIDKLGDFALHKFQPTG